MGYTYVDSRQAFSGSARDDVHSAMDDTVESPMGYSLGFPM